MPDTPTYSLESIIVDSVGLVTRGAVSASDDEGEKGKNFLLIKQEEPMADEEVVVEEVVEDTAPTLPEDPPESWFEKFANFMKGQSTEDGEEVSKPDPKALANAAKVLQGGGYNVSPTKLGRMLGMDDEEKTQKGDETPEEEEQPMSKQEKLPEPVITDLVKAEVEAIKEEYAGVLEEVKKANADLKEENDRLRKDLDDLSNDRDIEKAQRRKIEAIKKAESMKMLPTQSTDLAELLMKAEDALGDDFKNLEALLKATDRQLWASGLYAEMGTSRSPEQVSLEDKVAKIAKEQGIPYEEALLSLTEAEQYELQKSWQEQAGGK